MKGSRRGGGSKRQTKLWNKLPWKPLSYQDADLGEFDESVLFGLEEIDGNAYKLTKNDNGYSLQYIDSNGKPRDINDTDDNDGDDGIVSKSSNNSIDENEVIDSSNIAIVDDDSANDTVEMKSKKTKKARRLESIKKKKEAKLKAKNEAALLNNSNTTTESSNHVVVPMGNSQWGGSNSKVKIHSLLYASLIQLGFLSPTPIQEKAIPISIHGRADIIGAAETGSGKTLAFGLPIIDYILQQAALASAAAANNNYNNSNGTTNDDDNANSSNNSSSGFKQSKKINNNKNNQAITAAANNNNINNNNDNNNNTNYSGRRNEAVAIIIAPTRELALQITKVLKDVCTPFKDIHTISIVSIVGGMSEQKQRRLLGPHSRPPDILVGTPGRLCEMIQDVEIVTFQDMSRLRFLVVDEADRIVEEGHFPELHRLFSRIRDHEKLAARGLDPKEVERLNRIGTYDEESMPMQLQLLQSHSQSQAVQSNEQSKKEMIENYQEDDEEEVEEGEEENIDDNDEGDNDDNDNNNDMNENDEDEDNEGNGEDDEEDEEDEEPFNDEFAFEPMPSQADIELARQTQVNYPSQKSKNKNKNNKIKGDSDNNNGSNMVSDNNENDEDAVDDDTDNSAQIVKPYHNNYRQTFLFSATAICVMTKADNDRPQYKQDRKRKRALKNIPEDLRKLPEHLQELLSVVAVRGDIQIIDVTGVAVATAAHEAKGNTNKNNKKGKSKTDNESDDDGGSDDDDESNVNVDESVHDNNTSASINNSVDDEKKTKKNKTKKAKTNDDSENTTTDTANATTPATIATNLTALTLPRLLTQYEMRSPSDDKDALTYLFLLKHPGRTLIFVNSIKTARRLDGLLRALELDCRTIHAQLQQRQRLRALESYQAASDGVLVATDVAARGLDISKIQYVIHYDIARSPQVYIHRSGRTARAGEPGTTVSIVSPEDTPHHSAVCQAQGLKTLPLYRGDLTLLPKLSERVQLAKKIFTASFVQSQACKSKSWLETTANEMDLEMDDNLRDEIGDDSIQQEQSKHSKKAIEKARKDLKILLKTPLESNSLNKGNNSYSNNGGNQSGQPNTKSFTKNKGLKSNRGSNNCSQLNSHKRSGFVVFAK